MFKNYNLKFLKNDIPAGIIVALVSIPISMGYAQVSGLPSVYGLYGSILPVLVFGLITTSPRFVFGVDAAPAALVGGMLYATGLTATPISATRMVPVFTLITAGWLFIFLLLKAGRFVRFISASVMGGFLSGICTIIVMMQIPKLFGGRAGIGEFPELSLHLYHEIYKNFSWIPFVIGILTIVLIQVSRRFMPRFPMAVVLMFAGALASKFFPVGDYGVKLLPAVEPGLPKFIMPEFGVISGNVPDTLLSCFSIALVIVSESLLSTNHYALKYDDEIDNNREILAYAAGNLVAGFVGSCPVNGSVSRAGIADQFGVKTQMMSLVSVATMIGIVMFGTGFIQYLPVPVLTGIVIAALINSMEFDLARKLRKVDKAEWAIFYVAFLAVLFLGTVYGVVMGVLLSFIAVIIRASLPPRVFLGRICNQEGFYPIGRVRGAQPIQNTIIYQFKGPLFFANIGQFEKDIKEELEEGTKLVIIDASGIGSVDVTASERLVNLSRKMSEDGIRFYFTEHTGAVNDQLRAFGAEELITKGYVRPSIEAALKAEGMSKPYVLRDVCIIRPIEETYEEHRLAEFEWAYGSEAEAKMAEMAEKLAVQIAEDDTFNYEAIREKEVELANGLWGEMDEDEFMDFLEMELALLKKRGHTKRKKWIELEKKLIEHHIDLDRRISESDGRAMREIIRRRMIREHDFREKYKHAYEFFQDEKQRRRAIIKEEYPELFKKIQECRDCEEKERDSLFEKIIRTADYAESLIRKERDDGKGKK